MRGREVKEERGRILAAAIVETHSLYLAKKHGTAHDRRPDVDTIVLPDECVKDTE